MSRRNGCPDMMGVDMEVERIHENGRYLLQRAYDSGITDPRELSVFMGQVEVESEGFRHLEKGMNYSARRLFEVFPARNGLSRREQIDEVDRRWCGGLYLLVLIGSVFTCGKGGGKTG